MKGYGLVFVLPASLVSHFTNNLREKFGSLPALFLDWRKAFDFLGAGSKGNHKQRSFQ
jgi:hypothetical protein